MRTWKRVIDRDEYENFVDYLEERTIACASYLILHKATIRQTAKYFGLNKSIVHRDLQIRLPHINYSLYKDVRKVLDANLAVRSFRGGAMTRKLWAERNKLKEAED